jgi:hypothetical protein
MAARLVLFAVGLIGLIGHALWPKTVNLSAGECTVYGMLVIVAMVPVLESFSMPGVKAVIAKSAEVAASSSEAVEAETAAQLTKLVDDRARTWRFLSSPRTEPEEEMVAESPWESLRATEHLNARQDIGINPLSDEVAGLPPRDRLITLRIELVRALRSTYQAIRGQSAPTVAGRLINALHQDGVLSRSGVTLVSAVLRAANAAAHARTVPETSSDEIAELTQATEVLLRGLPVSSALAFEQVVGRRLRQLSVAPVTEALQDNGWDFQVGEHLMVEAKYLATPTGSTARRVTPRELERIRRRVPEGARVLIVVSNNAVFEGRDDERIRVRRLEELTADDLGLWGEERGA